MPNKKITEQERWIAHCKEKGTDPSHATFFEPCTAKLQYKVDKASDWKFKEIVEIGSLDDLMNLSALHGGANLVVCFGNSPRDMYPSRRITIYDDYIE